MTGTLWNCVSQVAWISSGRIAVVDPRLGVVVASHRPEKVGLIRFGVDRSNHELVECVPKGTT